MSLHKVDLFTGPFCVHECLYVHVCRQGLCEQDCMFMSVFCGQGRRPPGKRDTPQEVHSQRPGRLALPSCLPSQAQAIATWPLRLELVAGLSPCWLHGKGELSECDHHVLALLIPGRLQCCPCTSQNPPICSWVSPRTEVCLFWGTGNQTSWCLAILASELG